MKITKTVEMTLTSPCEVEVTVNVKFDAYSFPAVFYIPNGDPGYPAEEGIDILDVTMHDGSDVPDWIDDDIIIAYIENNLELLEPDCDF